MGVMRLQAPYLGDVVVKYSRANVYGGRLGEFLGCKWGKLGLTPGPMF